MLPFRSVVNVYTTKDMYPLSARVGDNGSWSSCAMSTFFKVFRLLIEEKQVVSSEY